MAHFRPSYGAVSGEAIAALADAVGSIAATAITTGGAIQQTRIQTASAERTAAAQEAAAKAAAEAAAARAPARTVVRRETQQSGSSGLSLTTVGLGVVALLGITAIWYGLRKKP